MKGQIIYEDGTTEPILTFTEREYECEVTAPSGKYLYQTFVQTHESGYKIGGYWFLRFDYGLRHWIVDNRIKEFQIMEENRPC